MRVDLVHYVVVATVVAAVVVDIAAAASVVDVDDIDVVAAIYNYRS